MTRFTLEMSKAAASRATALITLASGGYEVYATVDATDPTGYNRNYCLPGDDHELCSDSLRIYSRDGRFTAVISGQTRTGDILYEQQKVGAITRTSVNVNGVEYSLY